MIPILPCKETAAARRWTHQVQWMADGRPCFVRCKSRHAADAWVNRLKDEGQRPVVIDLIEALRLTCTETGGELKDDAD